MAKIEVEKDRSAEGHREIVPPWWRDQRKRAFLWQILVLVALGFGIAFVISNLKQNLQVLGIPFGFDFLDSTAGFAVSFSLLSVNLESKISTLIMTGMLNTVLASAIGIVFATIWGFILGVLRLSGNFLVARLAAVYIEITRNVPLLVQLLFWYTGIVKLLPNVRQAIDVNETVFLSNRGFYMPRPIPQPDSLVIGVVLLIAIAIIFWLARWAKKRQEATGRQFPIFLVSVLILLGLPIVTSLVLGNPVKWETPVLAGFNFEGGSVLLPELAALVIGLTAYTSAFIAEIVRGGILAVNQGQTEAALSLGMKRNRVLRLIVIPQALRIIIPPLTSQYLNIAKNSTLAGIIGYPDLYSIIGTTQNQTGRAVESVTILMLFFLALSLLISLFMNWYNKRVALVER